MLLPWRIILTNRTGASNEWISSVFFRIFPFVNDTVIPVPKFAEASKNATHECQAFGWIAECTKTNANPREATLWWYFNHVCFFPHLIICLDLRKYKLATKIDIAPIMLSVCRISPNPNFQIRATEIKDAPARPWPIWIIGCKVVLITFWFIQHFQIAFWWFSKSCVWRVLHGQKLRWPCHIIFLLIG